MQVETLITYTDQKLISTFQQTRIILYILLQSKKGNNMLQKYLHLNTYDLMYISVILSG